MPNRKKSNGSYNYLYFATALICLIVAVIIVSLVAFGNFGGTAESSAPAAQESSSAPSEPVSAASEESTETGMLAGIELDNLTVNNADVKKGRLVVITSADTEFRSSASLDLVRFYGNKGEGYALSGTSVSVESEAQKKFDEFLVSFAATVPKNGIIIDRGYTDKDTLVKNNILETYADLTSGSSVKFGLSGTTYNFSSTEFAYLYEQAYKYGIIQRYPSGKEGVTGKEENKMLYRYVGIAHTQYMHIYNLTLEEYTDMLRSSDTPLETVSALEDNVTYIVYYAKMSGTEADTTVIRVPADPAKYPYEISGDGKGGFIVTVRVSTGS